MAIIDIARELKVMQLYALCHPDNRASIRVLEKCDFRLEQRPQEFLEFPNLTIVLGRHSSRVIVEQSARSAAR
jgi:RimJ/RimL family protein N-acetyltransferase